MAKGKRKRGKATGAAAKHSAGTTTRAETTVARRVADSGTIAVPVAEERLNVAKQAVELGEVELRKTVVREQVEVPVELRREEVNVRQVDTADRAARAGEALFREGTIRVPVLGEEAIVTKEAVVTGEVVLGKETTTERQTITDSVRKERVEVDEQTYQTGATTTAGRRTAGPGRT